MCRAGEFTGKVVLVTGGASGTGRSATLAFARAGARVVFTYLTSRDEAERVSTAAGNDGHSLLGIMADLSQPDAAEQALETAEREVGPIDIVFANAGTLVERKRCVDTSLDLWQRVVEVNLTSTFLTCRAALRRMEPRRSGAIITMSAQSAFDGGGNGASHYAAMKGAIVTYTRALAREVGPLGIRVNCVSPGLIAGPFQDRYNTLDARGIVVERMPLRREGTGEDVADTVLYLASQQASFITGEVIQINGGLGMF